MDLALLIGAAVLLVAVGAATFSSRLGLPSLLLFLGLGLAMGDAGLGIRFSDASLAHNLGFAALVVILAEGGLTTQWSTIRKALGPASLLATVGIGVSVSVIAVFAHYVVGVDWAEAVMMGAILSPTDSAAVFSVLRKVPIPSRIGAILEGESGLNDAPTVILVTVAAGIASGQGEHTGMGQIAGVFALELFGGLAVGIAIGVLGVATMRSFALPSTSLTPLAAMGWCVLSYGLGSWVHVSGFAAVYVTSMLLGNGGLPHRRATRSFFEGIAWVAQIGLFVMLGLLASPGRLNWSTVAAAVGIGALVTLVARPLSVVACLTPFRVGPRAQAFVAWAGLRGAVPIILATVPMAAGLPAATRLFDIVFVFVIIFTFLQGPTLPLAARWLGLAEEQPASELEVEAAPLEKISAELLYVKVPQDSRLRGVSITELRLPARAVVSLIVRDGSGFAPVDADIVKTGDELLVVTPAVDRIAVEERLRQVDLEGRLAGWTRDVAAADI